MTMGGSLMTIGSIGMIVSIGSSEGPALGAEAVGAADAAAAPGIGSKLIGRMIGAREASAAGR